MKDAHRALREGTRAEHERLDGLFEAFDLADPEHYARFLSAHAEALLPVEAALDGVAARVIPDWSERKRSAEVLADLAALGRDVREFADIPELDVEMTTPAIAGALYVIEGSRLGGRVLVKQVGRGLPTAYLGGEQPRGRWPLLLEAIDTALPDAVSTSQAVASARAVFDRFEAAGRRWSLPG